MTQQPAKPLPQPSAISQPFWDGLAEGALRIQRCEQCGRLVFYPRPYCPDCLSDALTWTEMSGRGRVYTYTVVRRAMHPAFQPDVPYVFAIVELAEGPRLPTNVIGCAPEDVRVEMAVKAVYDRTAAGIALLKFEPA
jgi:uncharacterized OB-fold protein